MSEEPQPNKAMTQGNTPTGSETRVGSRGETPRTNKAILNPVGANLIVSVDFARQLERETQELKLLAERAEENIKVSGELYNTVHAAWDKERDSLKSKLAAAEQEILTRGMEIVAGLEKCATLSQHNHELREALSLVKCDCNFNEGHEPYCPIVKCNAILYSSAPSTEWIRRSEVEAKAAKIVEGIEAKILMSRRAEPFGKLDAHLAWVENDALAERLIQEALALAQTLLAQSHP